MVVADLLAPLDVAGMMLTLDALHTTKKPPDTSQFRAQTGQPATLPGPWGMPR
jgi:hypothetical protein